MYFIITRFQNGVLGCIKEPNGDVKTFKTRKLAKSFARYHVVAITKIFCWK